MADLAPRSWALGSMRHLWPRIEQPTVADDGEILLFSIRQGDKITCHRVFVTDLLDAAGKPLSKMGATDA